MQWRSPWGQGFPGWHAECTVMARRYLGLPFDIHGGGLENIFPHNESEIAQCEAAYNESFAKAWLFNNMVTIDGVKMGKSLGNSMTIQNILQGDHARLSQAYSPMAMRFFILSSHYRQTTDFSDVALDSATKGYKRLLNTIVLVQQKLAQTPVSDETNDFAAVIADHNARFVEAMDNDFNTPQALAVLFDFNKAVNSRLNNGQAMSYNTLKAIDETYQTLAGDVLGLLTEESVTQNSGSDDSNLQDSLMSLLIDLRASARKNKDYATGDTIRKRLTELGVVLEDRPDGTSWKRETV
jgi:cysteinyl-tRNA synthetase